MYYHLPISLVMNLSIFAVLLSVVLKIILSQPMLELSEKDNFDYLLIYPHCIAFNFYYYYHLHVSNHFQNLMNYFQLYLKLDHL